MTDLPWIGSDGNPLSDVSAYAQQMTYANIMSVVSPSYPLELTSVVLTQELRRERGVDVVARAQCTTRQPLR